MYRERFKDNQRPESSATTNWCTVKLRCGLTNRKDGIAVNLQGREQSMAPPFDSLISRNMWSRRANFSVGRFRGHTTPFDGREPTLRCRVDLENADSLLRDRRQGQVLGFEPFTRLEQRGNDSPQRFYDPDHQSRSSHSSPKRSESSRMRFSVRTVISRAKATL